MKNLYIYDGELYQPVGWSLDDSDGRVVLIPVGSEEETGTCLFLRLDELEEWTEDEELSG